MEYDVLLAAAITTRYFPGWTGKKAAEQSAVPKPSLGDFLVASQPQFLRAA